MTHAASKDDLRVSTLFDFSSHIVLVTGGATGLGEMAAQAFVQNGSRVFIASRKDSELASTSSRLNALGPGTCEYIVADLKNKAGCVALCEEMAKRVDRLTVLVNNTGASWGDDYYNYPEHAWDKLYDLNVKNIFYMTVGMEPLLLKGASAAQPGRVINIASMAGIQTMDVTTGEGGGLSQPGTGTFSCKSSCSMSLSLSLFDLDHAVCARLIAERRWTGQSCVYSSHQDDGVETRAQEYHGQRYLSWCFSVAHDEFRIGEV
jgi:NAD(P)-dependent dehydrogenase (short-subunit alcohol dehydrogenase family)